LFIKKIIYQFLSQIDNNKTKSSAPSCISKPETIGIALSKKVKKITIILKVSEKLKLAKHRFSKKHSVGLKNESGLLGGRILKPNFVSDHRPVFRQF